MKRARFVWTLVALALTMGLGVAACGDGEAPDLETYFADLEGAFEQLDEDTEPLNTRLASNDDLDDLRDAFESYPGTLDSFADALEDLRAPGEVAELHDAVILAVREFESEIRATEEAVQEADSVDAFYDVAGSIAINNASDEFGDACRTIQSFGRDQGVAVDLGC